MVDQPLQRPKTPFPNWDTKTFNRNHLHKLVYYETREQFKLSAQATVRAIAKVVDSYKLDKKTQRTFKPHGGIAYDLRLLRYKLADNAVSIWTLDGRIEVPYVAGERQHEQLKTQKGESDLLYKERRHATNVNHVISKQIVKTAKDTNRAIAMEDLSGIRQRVTVKKSQRDDLHSWSFYQLNQFTDYKAQQEGILKLAIDPHWSSQECAVCGYIDKRNRKTQSNFLCLRCGNVDHADDNAASVLKNRGRAVVNLPIVSDANWTYSCPLVAPGTSPRALAGGS